MPELQPYDRQSTETESAWLAFCCYRDLGQGRTLEGAGRTYREVKGSKGKSASRHFVAWRKEHNWDSRCVAFDRDRSNKIQDSLLEEDKEKYIQSVEGLRKRIENFGNTSMTNATMSHALTTSTINLMLKRSSPGIELSRADLQTMILLGKRDRDSMAIFESAKNMLVEALGLVPIIEKLNAVETED